MAMDFHGLLYAAHKNEVSKDKGKARYYPSSFAPPKKEEKTKGLSVNVKKFLARKEEEEKQRKIEEERKREALLQLRNQDNKAKKRVQVMLKRTKSYNKSVLEDAIDEVNTADTMNGPQQCDEDDYGYVSQEASSFYSKMMEKYGSVPTDEKFSKKGKALSSDLGSTKDRVKLALQRQEEEEMGPHKRKRKKKENDVKDSPEADEDSRHSSDRNDPKEKEKEKEREEKPKPKRAPAPPPLDFSELLKMAEKKQHEPPPLEIKLKEVKRQPKEPERLMTKKEKMEYERTRDKRLQRENNSRPESKPDKKEKEREDERKRLKEQRAREEERNRRQRDAEREQDRRRQEDREQDRRRQEEREKERRRQEEDTERQRERERIRELEEELARHKERERMRELEMERREKDRKPAPVPKKTDGKIVSKTSSFLSSNRPKEVLGKTSKSVKPSDRPTSSKVYRNGEVNKKPDKIRNLFGDRDSASPERSSSKTDRPKPRPVERIKVNNASSASVDDLFADYVTIRTKQKTVPNSDKPSGTFKVPQGVSKPSRDEPRKDKSDLDRKRPSDGNRDYPDKRPKMGDSRNGLGGKVPVRKEFPPKDLKSRQFPPADVRPRQFPPADVRSRQFPPSDVARKNYGSNRGRFEYERADSEDSSEEDEDEYDSEMDDFIDDGPENGEDISKYIKDIFGYDKSRYANDSNSECMESNYSQVMREEVKSAKIGLMEDIEDMKKEEMEKRLKAMKKARKR